MIAAAQTAREESTRTEAERGRFYKPELDALRFLAFLMVLVHHGPVTGSLTGVVRAGGFGLSIFFLLSAYLITELLLRERSAFGTVNWGKFFIRRALRIWPLYYAVLILAAIWSLVSLHHRTPPQVFLAMALFVGNKLSITTVAVPIGHLWSISIEEQFYLLWAPINRFGKPTFIFGFSALLAAASLLWIFNNADRGADLWFDTPTQFLFFAIGAMLAFADLRRELRPPNTFTRLILLTVGGAALYFAGNLRVVHAGDPIRGAWATTACFLLAAIGSTAIFVAFKGLKRLPQPVCYLGKISYGLYMFHIAVRNLVSHIFPEPPSGSTWIRLVSEDLAILVTTILLAHLSYRYFESKFLKLKEAYSRIPSRPV